MDAGTRRGSKLLFCMLHPGYMRYYYTALRELARRGHSITIAFDNPRKQAKDRLQERIVEEFPGRVRVVDGVERRDRWRQLARALSWGMDFARYLTPRFRSAHRLRVRVELNVHPAFRFLMTRVPILRGAFGARATVSLLRRLYDALPAAPRVVQFIRDESPDAVLVSPLITSGNPQCEYVKAARAAGVPVAHAVASWDNLSSKGLIRGNPDRVICWNRVQRKEALQMHAIRDEQVVITGAQNFDDWFSRRPSCKRREFLDRVGLREDRPYLLYLCSSVFMAPNETSLVLRLVERLRARPGLSNLGLLVRPYPEHVQQWESVPLAGRDDLVLWPPAGEYPLTEEARSNFYDSIHHAAAVIGVNTSAMIEAAIVGRPVFTVLAEEFNDSQVNTIHFQYLLRENGGFLQVSHGLDELCDQLASSLADPEREARVTRDFIGRFIRPAGLEEPCVPRFAAAVEELAGLRVHPWRPSWGATALRPLLWPAAAVATRVARGKAWQERRGQWKVAAREAEARGIDPIEHAAQRFLRGVAAGEVSERARPSAPARVEPPDVADRVARLESEVVALNARIRALEEERAESVEPGPPASASEHSRPALHGRHS